MPLSLAKTANPAEVVGQVGNLRRVGNPPEPLVNGPAGAGCRGTLWVARRIPSCPTINAGCSAVKSRRRRDLTAEQPALIVGQDGILRATQRVPRQPAPAGPF